MGHPISDIREEFDRIDLHSNDGWDHNSHYHKWLLNRLPSSCSNALDIGCGSGSFSRLLAERSERVVALDLSPNMIGTAKERSTNHSNMDFQVADVLKWEFPAEHFDCVVSIATLHHLPLEEMLIRMRDTLRPGGMLLILDLFEGEGPIDIFLSAFAMPLSFALRLIRCGRLRQDKKAREAWAEHARNDSFPTLSSVRRACEKILPGARVRKHLLWRYSIVWRKP